MGAIFTDTILSSLVSSYRILVRPCRRADRVMPWPLIRKVVSCVCKPMSGSFPSPGKSKSLHQRAEMWAPIGVLPWRGYTIIIWWSPLIQTPFVGIAAQVADYVEKYSALSDQPGAYAVTGKSCVACKF